ncbi:methyl-accepting chemotaxis protein [Halopiger goleimassiliensis]|uniref:methyl-accepting chemotaxis protein n=1 Tax=Halopiger goleimassiliensis TaxID=1293048 RepID=UPI0006777B55|nr:methyl-accepting chemotaxis protein [Halopiger goleimassiliensis]
MGLNPWEFVPIVRRRYALRFLVALAVVVVLVGAFGGSIYAHAGAELQSDVESQLVSDAQKDANRLDTWFDSTERYFESLPRSTAFRNDDHLVVADALHRTTDRASFAGAYYVNYETGAVDADAGTDGILEEGRLTDAVDDRLATAIDEPSTVTFSDPFETADGRPAMLVVSEVPGDSEHAVVGLVDLESLSRYMIGTDATDDVVVVDDGGTVVLAGNHSLLLGDDALDPAAFENVTGTTSIDASAAESDDDTVVGYASLETDDQDWTLTGRVPASEAYSLQSAISNRILAMIGVVFASMLLLGVTVGRNTAGSLRHLSERAAAIEDGNLETPVESDRSDELGDLHRSIDRMRRSLRDRLEEAETARAEAERERERAEQAREEAERARAESEAFSRHLEETADAYGETMRACADGDLTRRLEPDDESEAMATIAAEFNAMIDDIEETVAATRAFAEAVDEAADATADDVVEVRSASEQVASSVQQIAAGADRQSEQLSTINGQLDDLSTTTEEIATTASEVATLAERTAETSSTARESASNAIEGMNAIEDEADAAVDEVDQLEAELEAIDDLLAFIRKITNETNMLALNANIEAARESGSGSGSGFAAVAEEVKSLSEDTKEAADDIEERLERVNEQAEQVAAVVRETDARIAAHRSEVEDAIRSLEEISEFTAETNVGIQEISSATQQQAAATQQIVAMTDDVTAISEETAAEAETAATAAEEQASSIRDVSSAATALSEQARELAGAVSAFEVSTDLESATETDREDPVVLAGENGTETDEKRDADSTAGDDSESFDRGE